MNSFPIMPKFDIEKYRANIGKLYKMREGSTIFSLSDDKDDIVIIIGVVFDPEVGDVASYELALPEDMRGEYYWDCRRFHREYEEVASPQQAATV